MNYYGLMREGDGGRDHNYLKKLRKVYGDGEQQNFRTDLNGSKRENAPNYMIEEIIRRSQGVSGFYPTEEDIAAKGDD